MLCNLLKNINCLLPLALLLVLCTRNNTDDNKLKARDIFPVKFCTIVNWEKFGVKILAQPTMKMKLAKNVQL